MLSIPIGQFERLNGGPPFGDTLTQWLKNSPGFNWIKCMPLCALSRMGFPEPCSLHGNGLLAYPAAEASGPGLSLPDAPHELVKPWERMCVTARKCRLV